MQLNDKFILFYCYLANFKNEETINNLRDNYFSKIIKIIDGIANIETNFNCILVNYICECFNT